MTTTTLTDFVEKFFEQLQHDIANDRIVLPSLPDVIVKIRQVVDDPNASITDVAAAISKDTVISARLLKVSNSPLYQRGSTPVADVSGAVSRLGVTLVQNLVTHLAIIQLMTAPTGALGEYIKLAFRHATEVAVLAYGLAAFYTKINPNQALLAGLIHDIGYLPIYQKASKNAKLMENTQLLQSLALRLHTNVGTLILEKWNFSPEFVEVVWEHENIHDVSGKDIRLVDILVVANIESHRNTQHPLGQTDYQRVPAYEKLGILSTDKLWDQDDMALLLERARLVFSL